ncbi:MAG TPA: CcmD family protein [Polyangiaceae bacterium]|nr:CcmD family protein [Polyangiaceae bacterium]
MSLLAPETTELTPESRSTEFVPVQGGNESTSAEHLLVAAYLLMWAAVFTFIFLTWRKQGRMEERISALDSAIADAKKRS